MFTQRGSVLECVRLDAALAALVISYGLIAETGWEACVTLSLPRTSLTPLLRRSFLRNLGILLSLLVR